jgi:hypothetical protein
MGKKIASDIGKISRGSPGGLPNLDIEDGATIVLQAELQFEQESNKQPRTV